MTTIEFRAATLFLSLCVAMAPVRALASATLAPVQTSIDTKGMDTLPDHAKFVRGKVEAEAATKLGDLDTAAPAEVSIRVEFSKDKKIGYYAYAVSSKWGERELASDVVSGKCELCDTSELMAKVSGALDVQRKALERENAAASAAASVVHPPNEPTGPLGVPAGVDDPPSESQPPRWTALGKTGVGLMVVGLGVGIAGIPLAVRSDRVRNEPPNIERGSTHRLGLGLAIAGGAALVIGTVLLVVDVSLQKKKRTNAMSRMRFERGGLAVSF